MGRIKMNRPIILDNAVIRSGGNNKTFEYNYSKDLNVIKIEGSTMLFIDSGSHAVELATKTRVERESDDEEFDNISKLSAKTKRERYSKELSLLELETKTFIERERDDEEDISYN